MLWFFDIKSNWFSLLAHFKSQFILFSLVVNIKKENSEPQPSLASVQNPPTLVGLRLIFIQHVAV